METNKKIALAAVGAYVFWYYLLRGWSGTKVWLYSYEYKGMDIINRTFNIDLNIAVKNPLLVSIPVHRLSGTIYLNNDEVANIDVTYDKKVNGRATNIIPVPVSCKIGGVGDIARMAIDNGNLNGQTLMVMLNLELGNGDKSLNIPINTSMIIGEEA